MPSSGAEAKVADHQGWIDLEQIATVEVTSENPKFPAESALGSESGPGWRSADEGPQRIRIVFDEPLALRRIHLAFAEKDVERTQEFCLRWLPAANGPVQEIVRQQWNFSPTGSTTQVEDYSVDLHGVTALELEIRPDIGGRKAFASLESWRLA